MEYKNYCKILGFARDASTADIQRAWRKLERHFYLDVNKAPEAARFVEISEAKEVLKDPEKRKLYDVWVENWGRAEPQTPPVVPHKHNPVFITLTCLESNMKQTSR